MNCTGTERQRAVVAAFKMRPEATYPEIASAAGVTVIYAGMVIRDYLASRPHDQSLICQVPTRQTLAVVKDVAVFQRDKRLHAIPQGSTVTAKRQAIQIALADNPRADGEKTMVYCRRIAAITGLSADYVQKALDVIRCEAIGEAARAKEAEELKGKIVPLAQSLGPIRNFQGWLDAFSKFKATAEAYLLLAQVRGAPYASAYLKDIRDISDRAQSRAAMSQIE